ncbi:MAG: hypothetical protein KDD43_03340, partial [Bdellovibrionales bacterium]|nr:hypothetical protein [Bdellovibrionales bacterium]
PSVSKRRLRRLKVRLIVSIASALGVLFMFGVSLMVGLGSSESEVRQPAQITGKSMVLRAKHGFDLKHTHKLKGPLSVVINHLESDQAITSGSPFTLEAVVVSSEYLENVRLKWVLPDGVQLENGARETVLNSINRDEPQKISVTLVSESDENLQVHLQASAQLRGMSFGESVQFNTTDQQLIDLQKAELLERSQKEMAKDLGTQQKVFH